MKTKLVQLSILLSLCFTAFKAQVSAYTFTQSSSSYGSASSGTLVGGILQDDDVNTLSLPFTFTYNGTAYNTIDVCANGYVSFNTLSGFEYTPISDLTTQDLIAPFGQDLLMTSLISADMTSGSNTLTNCSSVAGFSVGDVILDYNGDFGSVNPTITAISGNNIVLNISAANTISLYDVVSLSSYIKENVSGVSPNRIYEIEFRRFTRYGVYDEVINFKLRLFETSNQIEFLYGTVIPGNDVIPSEVGLKGSSNSDYNSRKVSSSNTWATSLASTNITDVCDFDQSLFPTSGQSYKWTPVSCNIPTLTAVQSNTTLCSGNTATITVSGATSYTWVNGPSSAQLTVNPNSTTSYTVIGADGSCTNTLVVTQSVVATPSLSITQPNASICKGQSTTLTAVGATTYSWSNGVTTAANIITPSVTSSYILNGNNGSCSSTLSITQTVSECTSLNEGVLLSSRISVFPNPFNTEVQVKNTASSDASIQILDALGKVIYTSNLKSESSVQINTEHFTKGIYFIQIKSGSESSTKKLIKE